MWINPYTVVKILHPNPVLRDHTDPGDYFELHAILYHGKGHDCA